VTARPDGLPRKTYRRLHGDGSAIRGEAECLEGTAGHAALASGTAWRTLNRVAVELFGRGNQELWGNHTFAGERNRPVQCSPPSIALA